jgi:hypothetical protein
MLKLFKRVMALVVVTITLVACGGGTMTRGLFQGIVTGKPQAEVESSIGKPASVENLAGGKIKWVYKKRTFDPDNLNQQDENTYLLFEADKAGKLVVTEVSYG